MEKYFDFIVDLLNIRCIENFMYSPLTAVQ